MLTYTCSCRRGAGSAARRRSDAELGDAVVDEADGHGRRQDPRLRGRGEAQERRLGAGDARAGQGQRVHRAEPQGRTGVRVPRQGRQRGWTRTSQSLHRTRRRRETARLVTCRSVRRTPVSFPGKPGRYGVGASNTIEENCTVVPFGKLLFTTSGSKNRYNKMRN